MKHFIGKRAIEMFLLLKRKGKVRTQVEAIGYTIFY